MSSERCTLGGGRSDPDIPSDDVMICDRGIYVKVIKLIIISIVQSFTAPLDTIGPLYTLACHFNMNF